MKKLIITGIMMFLITLCSSWKEIPSTMSGFENGKGQIKGPIKKE